MAPVSTSRAVIAITQAELVVPTTVPELAI
jgi:hypothetical protein